MQWRLFEGIPGEDVRAVLALARRSTYRRGEVVFHRHDPADSVHLVVKGRFDVRIGTPVGDTVALGIRGPGETFGELAVMTEGERSATVTALEPGETLVVRGSELRRLARRVLELANVFGTAPPISIPLIQEDIAALAGTSRATVNRVLRDAERRGIVELRRGRTVVLDENALARLARAGDRNPAIRP